MALTQVSVFLTLIGRAGGCQKENNIRSTIGENTELLELSCAQEGSELWSGSAQQWS